MAEGVTDRDELLHLFAKRASELAARIGKSQSTTQMLDRGLPAAVYRESMSKLDKAVFPDKRTYLKTVTQTR
ncbi:MAG: hypothetical protein ACYSX0_11110 [Planctomycetota bacterium]|jgi:hypothetical protein